MIIAFTCRNGNYNKELGISITLSIIAFTCRNGNYNNMADVKISGLIIAFTCRNGNYNRFEYSEPIRRIIYTTNTVEGFNRQIRKITKTKGGFNNNKSLYKLVFLAYSDIAKKWEKSISNWAEIISQLSIKFDDRLNGFMR